MPSPKRTPRTLPEPPVYTWKYLSERFRQTLLDLSPLRSTDPETNALIEENMKLASLAPDVIEDAERADLLRHISPSGHPNAAIRALKLFASLRDTRTRAEYGARPRNNERSRSYQAAIAKLATLTRVPKRDRLEVAERYGRTEDAVRQAIKRARRQRPEP
jgi:hypothetical protein